MDNSPLVYLDIDVSRYIYETYFPTQTTKLNYNKVVEEFNYLRKQYDTVDHYIIDDFGIRYRSCTIRRCYFLPTLFLDEIKYGKL